MALKLAEKPIFCEKIKHTDLNNRVTLKQANYSVNKSTDFLLVYLPSKSLTKPKCMTE